MSVKVLGVDDDGDLLDVGGGDEAACICGAATSGTGKALTGVPVSAGSMTRRQIWAGHDPPVTRIGVAGGIIDRCRSGKPTHTAATRSGV